LAMTDVVVNTRDKIKSWLTEEGLFKEEVPGENLDFQIAAEFPVSSGRHLSIIQPRDHEDMIVVFSRIMLADVHQKAFSALPPKEREHLLWQMRYDLLFQESSFEIEPVGLEMRSIRFTRARRSLVSGRQIESQSRLSQCTAEISEQKKRLSAISCG